MNIKFDMNNVVSWYPHKLLLISRLYIADINFYVVAQWAQVSWKNFI